MIDPRLLTDGNQHAPNAQIRPPSWGSIATRHVTCKASVQEKGPFL